MAEPITKYSDSELYALLNSKKRIAEAAFAELYSRHSQRIYAYCLRVTGNVEEAQDIFQEAFLKFYDSAKVKKELDNVPGYLLMITRNLCLNYRRDSKKEFSFEDYHFHINDTGYEKKEQLELISSALECLEFEFREAFVLRLYHGLKYREIAEITGNSESNVKNRVWRAKEKIKEILQPYLKDISNEK